MFYPIQLEWSKEGYVGKPKGLYIWREPFDDENVDWVSHGEYIEDCELMQYTGIKDKNGKEIYEGDILYNKKTLLYPITFYYDKYLSAYLIENGSNFLGVAISKYKLEVIGNIYENPELLEQD